MKLCVCRTLVTSFRTGPGAAAETACAQSQAGVAREGQWLPEVPARAVGLKGASSELGLLTPGFLASLQSLCWDLLLPEGRAPRGAESSGTKALVFPSIAPSSVPSCKASPEEVKPQA